MDRLFNRFRAHGSGTFVRWEQEDEGSHLKVLVYVPDEGGGETRERVQADLGILHDAYAPGDRIRLQFGELNNTSSSMMGGTRYITYTHRDRCVVRSHQMYVGLRCVSAISLARPQVALLALHMMIWKLGAAKTAVHLCHWRDGASTLQKNATLAKSTRTTRAVMLNIEHETLTASAVLSPEVEMVGRRVLMDVQIPDTMAAGLIGLPLSEIVTHPAFDDPALTVTEVGDAGGRTELRIGAAVGVNEAIEIAARMAAGVKDMNDAALPRAA